MYDLLHIALQLTPPLFEELPACVQQTFGGKFWYKPVVRFLELKAPKYLRNLKIMKMKFLYLNMQSQELAVTFLDLMHPALTGELV